MSAYAEYNHAQTDERREEAYQDMLSDLWLEAVREEAEDDEVD